MMIGRLWEILPYRPDHFDRGSNLTGQRNLFTLRGDAMRSEKAAAMISRMTTWLKNKLSAAEPRLQLDTKSSESGLDALIGRDLGGEETAHIAAAIAGLERGVPEGELRVIHGDEMLEKATAQFRRRKRISTIITEIGIECDRQARREGGNQREDSRIAVLEQARAAAAYAAASPLTGSRDKTVARDILWPWPADEFRPHDARRNLVIAGAHVITAIERFDRIATRAQAVAQMAQSQPAVPDPEPASPTLLFIRNRGMQPDHLIQGLSWLLDQRGDVLQVVANSPENLFDVFKKMAVLHPDEPVCGMFTDLAHGANVAGKDGEIHPVTASDPSETIDPAMPLLLLYPSFETLEWVIGQRGDSAMPWAVIPWDTAEVTGWLEDWDAKEMFG
jgi:hypothetical protein